MATSAIYTVGKVKHILIQSPEEDTAYRYWKIISIKEGFYHEYALGSFKVTFMVTIHFMWNIGRRTNDRSLWLSSYLCSRIIWNWPHVPRFMAYNISLILKSKIISLAFLSFIHLSDAMLKYVRYLVGPLTCHENVMNKVVIYYKIL